MKATTQGIKTIYSFASPVQQVKFCFFEGALATISELTHLFPRKIHAVTSKGLILKLVIFIVAYTLKKYTQTALVTAKKNM